MNLSMCALFSNRCGRNSEDTKGKDDVVIVDEESMEPLIKDSMAAENSRLDHVSMGTSTTGS
jgi:hypothetical protein